MSNQDFLRKELLDLQVKADELDAENIKLGKENSKYESENSKLRTTINELNDQLCNTVDRKEFKELTNKLESLTEKYENLGKSFKLMKKDNETLNNTYLHCLKNFNDLEGKCEMYKKENIELKSNISELKNISKMTLKDATIRNEEVEQQQKVISALQEENESLKTHLNYLKEQNKKNASILSCGADSFSMDGFNGSLSTLESMDIIVETKLRDCQKQLEETESKLIAKESELEEQQEQLATYLNELGTLKNEICTLEKERAELEHHLECEVNKNKREIHSVTQQLNQMKQDYETLSAKLSEKDEQLKDLLQTNTANQQRIENLENQLKENEEERTRLNGELDAVKERSVDEQSRLRDELQSQVDELINAHREELNVISLQQEQKLSTLTNELSKQEEEQMKIRAEIEELRRANSALRSEYDRLILERDELKKESELKDNKLIDLESENEMLNLELNKYSEEIKQIQECIDETEITLTQSASLSELTSEKEKIECERNELEKQVKELQSALSESKDEYSRLAKQHQEEIFKLSEAMNKKQDESKLHADLQNVFKELKAKEDQLSGLQAELEKRNELVQIHLIQIEKLKANDREKNHSMYLMKQKFAELEKEIKSREIVVKKLEAELKCTEDSFSLERKTKERYYRDMTELEKRIRSCPECTKLERSNSISFNARDQTLLVKNSSNPQLIQKIPNPSKYMMEDEEGQFMTNTHINEVRKRKTEHTDFEDDFKKRLNILQQRNLRQKPHLKTSYALEFQEVGTDFLNEKIKNSEKFVVDENTARNPSIMKQFSSSLRFRKH